jgi:hypothetical protein
VSRTFQSPLITGKLNYFSLLEDQPVLHIINLSQSN